MKFNYCWMKRVLLILIYPLFLCNIQPIYSQNIVWENQGLIDEDAITSGATFSDPANEVTVTCTWSTSTDGGSFVAFEGSDFVSYESGTNGNHDGYINMGFNNESQDQDDKITVTLSFNPAIQGLSFSLLDVDEADDDDGSSNKFWDDAVEVTFNSGTNANSMVSSSGSCVEPDNETFMTGYEGVEDVNGCGDDGVDFNLTSGNINYDFGTTYISSVTISYFSGDDLTGTSNPSAQLIGISDLAWTGVFPVEFLNFTANKSQFSSSVLLKWSTATEINNDYFSVEQSIDGRAFHEIGKVSGAGFSTEIREYTFEYLLQENIDTYFRIKQIDFDGSFSYSPVISFTHEVIENYQLQLEREMLYIKGYFGDKPRIIEIIDMQGRVQVSAIIASGVRNQISISDLLPGVYLFHIPDLDQAPQKFIKYN